MSNTNKLTHIVLVSSVLIGYNSFRFIQPAVASKVLYDQNCHVQKPSANDSDNWEPFFQANFQTLGQKYVLVALRYQDGSGILCVSKSNLAHLQPLQDKRLQGFIDRVVKKTENTFIVTIHEGNGSGGAIYDYRLTFSNAHAPIVKLVNKRQ